jgi:polysaccharide biosynthesis protein PelG
MLFVSLIKRYGRILLSYLGGMGVSVGVMFLLAKRCGIAGALAGFAAGQFLIFLALLVLSLRDYPPGKFGEGREWILPYCKKHSALLLTGQFYPLGIWGDKILFWFLSGERIGTTMFRLFPSYDIAVYIGTLTMIPGLVYFIIGAEPEVYVRIKKFLLALNIAKLREIQLRKYDMLRHVRLSINRLTVFGAVIAAAFILFTPQLVKLIGGAASPNHLFLGFSAVFAHFCFLVYMNVLFYLNLYRHTCIASFLFFIINCSVSFGIGAFGYTAAAGAGYLLGAAAAALYSYRMIFRDGKKIDRYILSGKPS